MNYKPFCDTELIFSSKIELEQIILSLDVTNIILIMSETSEQRWEMNSFFDKLNKKSTSLKGTMTRISYIPANPTQTDLLEILKYIGHNEVDTIIAVGGGSAIDLAKGISAFYNIHKNNKYSLEEITKNIKNKVYCNNEHIKIIAVPSTAGTGSELTQWATIWDENKSGKFSIDSPMLKPKMAIIVPELTVTMSPAMTLSTGLDAMCQAIEAYWSIYSAPIVQELSYRAVELIVQNLRKAVDEPDNIMVRERLCRASVMAGLAFSQTRTTACHSISYPLTMLYNIPHGLAASITLDPVAHINKGSFLNDSELMALFDDYNGIMNFIDYVCKDVINMRLSAFGITDEDIPRIIDYAFTGGRMDNNPVKLSQNDVRKILENVM